MSRCLLFVRLFFLCASLITIDSTDSHLMQVLSWTELNCTMLDSMIYQWLARAAKQKTQPNSNACVSRETASQPICSSLPALDLDSADTPGTVAEVALLMVDM